MSKAAYCLPNFFLNISKEILCNYDNTEKLLDCMKLASSIVIICMHVLAYVLAYTISWIESITKHELLPNHDPQLITYVIKPVWMIVGYSTRNLKVRYY